MMPSKGTRYAAEIERLRQERLAKLLTQAGLYSLKHVLVSCEVTQRWIEAERLKMLEGTCTLTAAEIGTLMRCQEKSLQLAKEFLGKSFLSESLGKADAQNAAPSPYEKRLKELEAQGLMIGD